MIPTRELMERLAQARELILDKAGMGMDLLLLGAYTAGVVDMLSKVLDEEPETVARALGLQAVEATVEDYSALEVHMWRPGHVATVCGMPIASVESSERDYYATAESGVTCKACQVRL